MSYEKVIPKNAEFEHPLNSRIEKLFYVVSRNNTVQSGIPFEKLVNLINENKENIGRLIIVNTNYLNRFYGDIQVENHIANSSWENKNKKALIKIEIPYNNEDWKSFLDEECYQKFHQEVLNIYDNDIQFKEIVNTLANKHKTDDEASAINYLIEECAVSLMLSTKGFITYPGNLNKAISYCFEKTSIVENPKDKFIKYKIRYYTEESAFKDSIIVPALEIPKKYRNYFLSEYNFFIKNFLQEKEKKSEEKNNIINNNSDEFINENDYTL